MHRVQRGHEGPASGCGHDALDAERDELDLVQRVKQSSLSSDAYVVFKLLEAIVRKDEVQYAAYADRYTPGVYTNHFFCLEGKYGAIIDSVILNEVTAEELSSLWALKKHMYLGTNQDGVLCATPSQVWAAPELIRI